jgi:hypothetical protein
LGDFFAFSTGSFANIFGISTTFFMGSESSRPIVNDLCIAIRYWSEIAASTAYMYCVLYYWVICSITGYGVPTTSVPCSFLLEGPRAVLIGSRTEGEGGG